MQVSISHFGAVDDQEIKLISIKNPLGQRIEITNYGGIVHAWHCPDNKGEIQDILLGCADFNSYKQRHPYFGAIVGRYANRIAFGHFTILDKSYQLAQNLPPHHLHGGKQGFDTKVWDFDIKNFSDYVAVEMSMTSPDGDEGYPGNLAVIVQYIFDKSGCLHIKYKATTDQATHINLTNHCYFNLSGNPYSTILDHQLQIISDSITESDASLIPTGKITPIKGTALDFNQMKSIGKDIASQEISLIQAKGYDHNFILQNHGIDQIIATVLHPSSGRRLQVFTDQPAIQLYTGNWLQDVDGKHGKYQDYSGFCLETQHYPDSPNHPNFPSTLLLPNQVFESDTVYQVDIY